MQILKKIIVPAVPEHIKEVVDYTVCDLCGAKLQNEAYEINESTVSCRYGESYPDNGHATHIEFDVCKSCFVGKLIPWMELQGVKPTITEADW